MRRMRRALKLMAGLVIFLWLPVGIASSQSSGLLAHIPKNKLNAEFKMARVMYHTNGGGGSHGIYQPWWAIDYPFAEEHFLAALQRLTNVDSSDDSWHLELSDPRIFEHPFLFLQQP